MLRSLSLSLLVFVFVSVASSQKLVFILAGQSNMSGRGGVTNDKWDHRIPPESSPSPSILRLDARLRWVRAQEPLHSDIDVGKPHGVGPGLPFAHAVIKGGRRDAVVGLVPCAIGGTRIAEWARGRRLYGEMVRRARAAAAGEDDDRVGAVIWYQGESDTALKADAEAYQGRMERLISDLRSDLQRSDLLVIQVALASGEGNFVETVRKAQLAINIPNVLTVDAMGLPLQRDRLHLTTEAQVQLGSMLADAYLNATHPTYDAHEFKAQARS